MPERIFGLFADFFEFFTIFWHFPTFFLDRYISGIFMPFMVNFYYLNSAPSLLCARPINSTILVLFKKITIFSAFLHFFHVFDNFGAFFVIYGHFLHFFAVFSRFMAFF